MFVEKLKEELNVSVTENGAVGYATTGKNLLDMNFKISSYRNKSDQEIIVDFKKAWYEDKELAIKFLFYVRDAREGAGERRLFRVVLKEIGDELDERVFDWIMKYGRADDLFVLINNVKLGNEMLLYIKNQLIKDGEAMQKGEPCSLLAKWMPSENTSSDETKKLAKQIRKFLKLNSKEYRQMLSTLRKYLDVTERKLCANEWSEVDYEKVSSQANLKYNSAFLRHDEQRRREYLGKLEKGEAKINSSVLFPHDIVHKYKNERYWYNNKVKSKDAALEGMWKGLPDYVNGESKILVVRDGSGSMESSVGNTTTTALDVATALSIYFSEKQEGEFKDKFITFSANPKFIDLSNYDNLHDKLERCYYEDECSNTDIEKTFDLVLKTAVNNHLEQKDIPDLLIISDMEFDEARGYYARHNDTKLFQVIGEKFNRAGYNLPKLIFWNVNSRTGTIPVKQNDNGVILVSGFSPAVTKMVLSNELDPYKALLSILNSERYKEVTLK